MSRCVGSKVFCPPSSSHSIPVGRGYYATKPSLLYPHSFEEQRLCPIGYYCEGGLKFPCPAGRFGNASGLFQQGCSGPCQAGYFCSPGSVISTQQSCSLKSAIYCPEGTSQQLAVSSGYYSVNGAFQVQCPPGTYCQEGIALPCPAGTYGTSAGLTTPRCDGFCPSGKFCPTGSISPKQHPCNRNSNTFCPPGSPFPTNVSDGYYVDDDHSKQIECEAGHYCQHGLRYNCPAGVYGREKGLNSSFCSGLCPAGYYCPMATVNYQECGDVQLYCPEGSAAPRNVSVGYYSVGGTTDTTQTTQHIAERGYYAWGGRKRPCNAGRYGNREGLTSPHCSGPCLAGFYCPIGSSSSQQQVCGGNNFFCPSESPQPIPVSIGFYTVFDDGMLPVNDTTTASSLTRQQQQQCEPGYYCVDGVKRSCPAGFFGEQFGLTNKECDGHCLAGFFCPLASSSPQPQQPQQQREEEL